MRKQIDGSTKYETVCQIEAGKISIRHAAEQLGVHPSSVQAWVRLYETEGISGCAKQKDQVYSEALKVKAVEAYLSGKGSLAAICKEYKIRARIQLQDWIKVYRRAYYGSPYTLFVRYCLNNAAIIIALKSAFPYSRLINSSVLTSAIS